MKILNPATEELIKEVEEETTSSLQKKYDALREGQRRWSKIPLEKRVEPIRRFSLLLEQNKESLAKTLTLEVGKPIRESLNELTGVRKKMQFFIDHASEILKSRLAREETGLKEWLEFEPLGVVANISAWNYPYLVGVNVFIPALIAGNGVLYKPSEHATLTGIEIGRLLWKSGIPEDLFQVAIGGGRVGEMVLSLPCDGFFFTGSYRTGQSIASAVGSRLIPMGLELGGKDPLYVMEDIREIRQVAAAAVEGSFYNNGQSCCAVERIYVQKKIFEPFLESFLNETKKLKVGDPTDSQTTQGSLARPQQIPFLEAQVKDAVNRGARLLAGGKRWGTKGAFFEPTIFTNVNHTMSLMREETFGPLIGIQQVQDDEEAVRLMNDTEFGLTAAVYSTSEERARAVLGQINTGTGYWNCCDRVSPYLPWSGRKHSGLGSTLSFLGLYPFVKPKAYYLRHP
ncbi:MAG: aldehyde dehydrogenase family protein [Deltaproteobacteria bacterium]|nr:aldehyde dehydrogenase family protein [Deltaproteobacteria bacterium]